MKRPIQSDNYSGKIVYTDLPVPGFLQDESEDEKSKDEKSDEITDVYEELGLDISKKKDRNMVSRVYNREYGTEATESSYWRTKILEKISKQRSMFYKFALVVANSINKPIEFVITEFPKDQLIPGTDSFNLKLLLEKTFKDIQSSTTPKEFYIKQTILNSILSGIKEYQEYLEKKKLTKPTKSKPIEATTISKFTGFKIGTSINSLKEFQTQFDNYNQQQTETIGATITDEEIIETYDKFVSNLKQYVKERETNKSQRFDDYEKVINISLIIVKNLMISLESQSNIQFNKISDIFERYSGTSMAFKELDEGEDYDIIPTTFLKKNLEFCTRISEITVHKIYKSSKSSTKDNELNNEIEYLNNRFNETVLRKLKERYDYEVSSLGFRLKKKPGKDEEEEGLSDFSEALLFLNELDNVGKLNDSAIKPWKDNDSDSVALIFFRDEIYGHIITGAYNVNTFAGRHSKKECFTIMELITSEQVYVNFAKHVSNLYTESLDNVRVRSLHATTKNSLNYKETHYQLLVSLNSTRGMVKFFKKVVRVPIKSKKTGKLIGTELIVVV